MSEMLKRALSGLVYILLLIGAVWYSELTCKFLLGFFLVFSILEYVRMQRLNPIVSFFIGIIFFLCFGFFNNILTDEGLLILAVFSVIVNLYLIRNLFVTNNTVIKNELLAYFLCLGYLVIPFLLMARIPFTEGVYTPSKLLVVFVLIWFNDTFAYLFGKFFGKRKLLEKISPKKTIEGFVGGALIAVFMGAMIGMYIFQQSALIWAIITIIIVIFATLGDLVESKFKRMANVKDSGNLMPGHGGILDRLDSIIMVSPFIFILYQILSYVS
ncbi:MAG: phosphatidate cytidylyltransferase [Bacteroidota bacterium]|nr:phosphatidate cytidylyltransferase [Bacteroidota bacterium]